MLEEKDLLEEVADIGKDADAEALKISTEEGHVEAPKHTQEAPGGKEETPATRLAPSWKLRKRCPSKVMLHN